MIILCTSNRIICALIFIVFISIKTQAQPKSLPFGFASVSGKGLETTTGGYGGETVTVKIKVSWKNMPVHPVKK